MLGRNLRTKKAAYWINVSQSSGAGRRTRLVQDKDSLNRCCYFVVISNDVHNFVCQQLQA